MLLIKKLMHSVWALPLAAVSVIIMIAANEISYDRSKTATLTLEHAMDTRLTLQTLISQVVDAETGQRGYLLTGQEDYLKPYVQATNSINGSLDNVRKHVASDPGMLAQFAVLSRAISRKLAELEMSIALKKTNQEIGWRALTESDHGKQYMDAIRTASAELVGALDRAVLRAKEENRETLIISRITIFTAALLTAIGFTLYFLQSRRLARSELDAKERLQQERDLLDQEVQDRTARLRELANYLESTRENERAHLARELHDELGALLTAAKLDVARLRSRLSPIPPEGIERIDHLIQTLDAGIALKRRIIEGLRPSSLDNLGLVPTLEILAKETADRSGLSVETNLEPVSVSSSVELTMFRLVQEAMTNICKYASARNVLVTLHQYTHHAELAVRDDGVGFDPDAVKSTSHGLEGMRQRVESAGGRMSVQSTPGKGTLIIAAMPLISNKLVKSDHASSTGESSDASMP